MNNTGVGVSPAFNVNLSSVIFSSVISSESPNHYKLSLLDKDLEISLQSGTSASIKGSTVTIPYSISGSNADAATHVTVLITDKALPTSDYYKSDAKILLYNPLETTESRTVSFDFSNTELNFDKWGTDYHVYILAEDVSNGEATNYASKPVELNKPEHVHDRTYAANDAVITASLCGTLGHTGGNAILMLNAPTGELTYDGTAKAASYTISPEGSDAFENPEIAYTQGGTALTSAPVNAGDCTAAVTLTGIKTAEGEVKSVNASVSYTISKAEKPIKITGTAALRQGGNTLDLSSLVNGTEGNVTYAFSGEANGCSLSGSTLTSGVTTGSVLITVTAAGNDNYQSKSGTITVTITEKEPQTLSFAEAAVTKTWGDAAFINQLSGAQTAVTYSVSEGADVADVATDGTVTIKAAGTARITATAKETADYASARASFTLTVLKKNISGGKLTLSETKFDQDGEQKTVTVVSVTLADGTVLQDTDYTISGELSGRDGRISARSGFEDTQ